MAKVVSPIAAKVEVIGKLKDGNYGQYRSVLFIDQSQPEGSEAAKIWKNLTDEEAQPLRKGATVQLIPAGQDKNGKDKHSIVLIEVPQTQLQPQPQPSQQQGWTPEQKRAIADKVGQSCDLLRFCYETAQAKFAGLIDDPAELRAIATTLFIQATR